METARDYYRHDGPMTALGAYAAEVSALPMDVASLCEVIQGVLIHRDIAPFLYSLKLSEADRDDGNLRPIAAMLARFMRSTHARSQSRASLPTGCPASAVISR